MSPLRGSPNFDAIFDAIVCVRDDLIAIGEPFDDFNGCSVIPSNFDLLETDFALCIDECDVGRTRADDEGFDRDDEAVLFRFELELHFGVKSREKLLLRIVNIYLCE